MGYVIKRTDQGGGYVTPSGSEHSYTRSLEHARIFSTRAEAAGHACSNERVIAVADLLQVGSAVPRG